MKALTMAFQWKVDNQNTNQKHSELLSAISELMRLEKDHVSLEYVPAQQDQILTPDADISRMAKLNIQMDIIAKAAAALVIKRELEPPKQTIHPLGFFPIAVHGCPICLMTSANLYQFISDTSIHDWWLTKSRYEVRDIPKIHWGVCTTATTGLPKSKQRFAAKQTAGFIGTGKRMKQ